MIQHPKILCLFSAPLVAPDGNPLEVLDMKTERDAIVRELAECKKDVVLRTGYATIDELAESIEEGFNILHLSGHGHEDFLLFEDGRGGGQPVPGDYLKRLIRLGGPFELAIVSACHSERIGELLVEAGIRHVVAIKSDVPVLDQAAITFIGKFFRSLFQGGAIQKAFEMAKLLVEGDPELMKMKPQLEFMAYEKGIPFVPEEEKFVLLPDDITAHLDPLLSREIPQGTLLLEEHIFSPSNLPVKPQTLTGRSLEMYDILNELLESRLVTVTGVGGIGKTVAAVEVARWFCTRDYFQDGVFHIDLRQTNTVGRIVDLLGGILGVQPAELADIISCLRDHHYLLLLDNAEDILWQDEDAMQDFIDTILKFTPNTKLLITSQRPVGGNLYEPERTYRIYPLEQEDAALLFFVTAKRRMEKEEWESDAFYRILEQLGGHPLSIVLTACQLVPGIVLGDLIERIEVYKAKAIAVKDITDRDSEHGESLVASLASSYDRLSENAQTLLGILSLLPAGAEEEMLTEIFGNTAWECIQELNAASLVEIRGHRRATLLPPVRLFAMSITSEEIRAHYGPKIVEVLKEYTEKLYERHGTQDAKEYRFHFTVNEPNLRSAIDLPCAPPQTAKERSVLGILGPRLIFLYHLHEREKEAKEVGDRILSTLRRRQDRLGEADALLILGIIAMHSGDLEEARSKYETALRIYQDIGYERGEANTLWKLGDLIMWSGNLEEARSKYETALTIYQYMGEKLGEAHAFMHLGDLIMWSGSLEEARSKYETALKIYQDMGEKLGEANAFWRLGDLAVKTGDLEEARSKYETALTIYQYMDDKLGEAHTLLRLSQWAALTDKLEHAETYLDDALALRREIGHLEVQAAAHMVKALVLIKRHDTAKAIHELACCSSIQDRVRAHSRAVQWLILYAVHLRLHGFKEGATLCLEYAEEFASKTQNQYLQTQVKNQRNGIS